MSNAVVRALEDERYVDALDLTLERLRAAANRSGAGDPATLAELRTAAYALHRGGDQHDAERVAQALAGASTRALGPDHPITIEGLWLRATVARYAADRTAAKDLLDEALVRAQRLGPRHGVLRGRIHQTLADWYRGSDFDRAIAEYGAAVALTRGAIPWPSLELADRETWLGWTLVRAGRESDARAYLDDAAAQLDALGLERHALMGTLLSLQADAAARRGAWADAEALYRRVAEIFTRCRASAFPGYSRRIHPLDGHDGVAAALLRRGRPVDAWRELERGRQSMSIDFIALSRWHEVDPEGATVYDQARRDRRRALDRIAATGVADTDLWSEPTWPLLVDLLSSTVELARLEAAFLARHRPPPPDPAAVLAALPPGTAVIGWQDYFNGARIGATAGPFLGSYRAFILRADRSGRAEVRWRTLFDSRDVARYSAFRETALRIRQFVERAARWPLRIEDDPALWRAADVWWTREFAPLLPDLADITTLVIEGGQQPYSICAPRGGASVEDRFRVVSVPSSVAVPMLGISTEAFVPRAPRRLLAVAPGSSADAGPSPVSFAGDSRGAGAVVRTRSAYLRREVDLRRLPALPSAQHEIADIARSFTSVKVPTPQRSASELLRAELGRRDSQRLDVLHIAAHTLADGHPERMALALDAAGPGDELIDAEAILLDWNAPPRLVTLSGCATARSLVGGRGELYGFVPALFGVGVPTILSSLWPVDDEATRRLMERFYENLTGHYQGTREGHAATPMDSATALREARHWLREWRDPSGARPFAHPVYWAGFEFFGRP